MPPRQISQAESTFVRVFGIELRQLKHGVFHSVVDLQAAINRFVGEYNVCDAKPFIWRANPDDIIAARNRGFQTLKSIH